MSSEHFINNIGTGWQDLYALTGLPVGTGMLVQNQSSGMLLVRRTSTRPPPNDQGGRRTRGDAEFQVDPGVPGCWIRGNLGLRLYIQADTP